MAFQVLFVGDLHLGRRPRPAYPDCDVSHTPADAWNDCVQIAIDHAVRAVVLAGDVVDTTEQILSSVGPFEDGAQRLHERGIPVYAVAGNHDKNALERLLNHQAKFHYLGQDGQWESVCLGEVGGVPVNVVGWSFPQEKVFTSPLADMDEGVLEDGISLGVVHCDRGKTSGQYAPVAASEFNTGPPSELDAWFLGHIHQPDALQGPRPVGYLGSATTLRRKDTGERGPWLVTVNGKSDIECQCIPINRVCYENVVCDLTDVELVPDEDGQVVDAIYNEVLERVMALPRHDDVRILGLRLELRGRIASYSQVQEARSELKKRDGKSIGPRTALCVVKVTDLTTPEIDLGSLSQEEGHLAGLMAAQLLSLEEESGEFGGDLRAAASEVEQSFKTRGLDPLTPDELTRMARDVGYDILMDLMDRSKGTPP